MRNWTLSQGSWGRPAAGKKGAGLRAEDWQSCCGEWECRLGITGPQDPHRDRVQQSGLVAGLGQEWPQGQGFPREVKDTDGSRAGGMWSIGGVSELVMRDGVSLRVDRVRAVEWGVSEGHQ